VKKLSFGFLLKTDPENPWASRFLFAAALYNVLWGSFVILFPNKVFLWTGLDIPNYPELWQCIGMIVGVYGVGYFIAAHAPTLHWPIVFVGLLGKVLGPIGFIGSMAHDRFNLIFGGVTILNDLIWWIPFTYILRIAWKK